MLRRPFALVLTLLACLALVAGGCTSDRSPSHPRAGAASEAETEAADEGVDEGLAEEIEEHSEEVAERIDALHEARAAGTLGKTEAISVAAATGWAGERPINTTGDDWEPAVAADPSAPYVYILHNRYGATSCAKNCPDPSMILHVSTDGGATWRPESFLCACKNVHGQFDPLIEVVPNTAAVYAVWMNDFNIVFAKSTNHGSTWSTPVPIYGNVSWGDKPNLATSPDGRDVYVLFNGPTDGDVYAAVSHDSGATWTQTRVTNDNRYHYDYGVTVLPTGRIVSSQISFTYTAPGAAPEGEVRIHVYASDDRGATWTDTVVDRVQLGSGCTSAGCYPDFYDSGPVLAQTSNGLTLVYTGATAVGAPRTAWSRSSTDGGRTWSARVTISTPGANAGFATAAGSGTSVRLWYGEQVNARWNVWYRTSTNLGASWSTPLKISDATSGTAYKNANGFLEMYGDYGEIAVTNRGKTIGVWAEGSSYTGPGQVWFNREL
jgi:hypothetical protein